MRAFLDTNIMYDMFCRRPFDSEGLLGIKIMHMFEDVELWVSAKSYNDLFYFIRREIGSDQTQSLLEASLKRMHVCSVNEEDIQTALGARWDDFEDCLINVCAEKVEADYLITRNRKGFGDSAIPHGSASEFMEFVFAKTNVQYGIEQA